MSRFFKNIDDCNLKIDDDSQDKKHDSEEERKNRNNQWEIGKRIKIINMRKLSTWLISDWKHKRKHMKLSKLPFEPVMSGLFYSMRLGGVWVTADYWLKHFGVDKETKIIRLEYLENDFKEHIYPLTNPNDNTIVFRGRDNSITLNEQEKDIYSLTGRVDLERIYLNNPYWAQLENKMYNK